MHLRLCAPISISSDSSRSACARPASAISFAASDRTLGQARRLMAAIGCTAHEIDIRPSATQMLKNIGHPHANGETHYDVTYENVQAGERTSLLFRLANQNNAIVVGTGDLS